MEQLLNAIQPGLTILAALIALFFGSIRLFWFFFSYDKELRAENLDKVKELNANYRKKNIEQRIFDLIKQSRVGGFHWGFDSVVENIFDHNYDFATGQTTRLLKSGTDIETYIDSVDRIDVATTAQKDAETFLYSDAGQNLFTALDSLYAKKIRINHDYQKIKLFCQVVCWCCLFMTALALTGMVMQFISKADFVVHFWFFMTISITLTGLICFGLLLHYRNVLRENWERQTLYGDE
jgi:hypothetical protein